MVIPSMKLHWDLDEEAIGYLTRGYGLSTTREAMAHIMKLYQGVDGARKIMLVRDKLLTRIQAILAKKMDGSGLQRWKDIMAECAYRIHNFICQLLGFIHKARQAVESNARAKMRLSLTCNMQDISHSHFAVAKYLNGLSDAELPSLYQTDFEYFRHDLIGFADTQRWMHEGLLAKIEHAIADTPGVASSFAMREFFRFPLKCLPSALPHILRERAGVHLFAWPDMQHLKYHIELEMNHGDLNKWPNIHSNQ